MENVGVSKAKNYNGAITLTSTPDSLFMYRRRMDVHWKSVEKQLHKKNFRIE